MAIHSVPSDFTYFKELVGAGLDGIAHTRRQRDNRIFTPPLEAVFWTPAAIGAAIGALSSLFGRRKSASTVAMGGLLGTVVGCGAAAAWASRGFIVPAARGAAERINAVRDARWLAANPITYA